MSNDTRTFPKLQEVKPKKKNRRPRGSPGKASVQKRKLTLLDRYVEESTGKRQRDVDARCPEGDSDADGSECMTSPFLFTCTTGMLAREHQDQLSMNVETFYKEHGASNRYVEVCSTCNIANKLGTNEEKGLFSILPIPTGTRICRYVGEIYTKQPKEGKFVMEVNLEVFIDAEHHPVDIGYLYCLDNDVAAGCVALLTMLVTLTPYTLRMSCQVDILSTINS